MWPSENCVLNVITTSLRCHDSGLQGTDTRQRVSKQNFRIWNKKKMLCARLLLALLFCMMWLCEPGRNAATFKSKTLTIISACSSWVAQWFEWRSRKQPTHSVRRSAGEAKVGLYTAMRQTTLLSLSCPEITFISYYTRKCSLVACPLNTELKCDQFKRIITCLLNFFYSNPSA